MNKISVYKLKKLSDRIVEIKSRISGPLTLQKVKLVVKYTMSPISITNSSAERIKPLCSGDETTPDHLLVTIYGTSDPMMITPLEGNPGLSRIEYPPLDCFEGESLSIANIYYPPLLNALEMAKLAQSAAIGVIAYQSTDQGVEILGGTRSNDTVGGSGRWGAGTWCFISEKIRPTFPLRGQPDEIRRELERSDYAQSGRLSELLGNALRRSMFEEVYGFFGAEEGEFNPLQLHLLRWKSHCERSLIGLSDLSTKSIFVTTYVDDGCWVFIVSLPLDEQQSEYVLQNACGSSHWEREYCTPPTFTLLSDVTDPKGDIKLMPGTKFALEKFLEMIYQE